MILWLVLAMVGPSAILSALIVFAPARASRLAFVPVRRVASVVLPPRVAEIAAPPLAGSGTYRQPSARDVALLALPGAARIERQGHVIRFIPELRCIVAHPAPSPARLLRVEVADDMGGWILRARRIPADELAGGAMAVALLGARFAGGHSPTWLLLGMAVLESYAIVKGRRAAIASFDTVLAEVKARVAVANGETPPPSEALPGTASRFTGPDEWTCACGEVNPRKRGMCRRCWSQRPKG